MGFGTALKSVEPTFQLLQGAPGRGEDMNCQEAVVNFAVGLHARPAALFVRIAQKHAASVTVTFRDKCVNAKSLLGLLSLGVGQGAVIQIRADGSDEDAAIDALVALVESGFGE